MRTCSELITTVFGAIGTRRPCLRTLPLVSDTEAPQGNREYLDFPLLASDAS